MTDLDVIGFIFQVPFFICDYVWRWTPFGRVFIGLAFLILAFGFFGFARREVSKF